MGSKIALAGDGCMASAVMLSVKRTMGSSVGAAITRLRANGRVQNGTECGRARSAGDVLVSMTQEGVHAGCISDARREVEEHERLDCNLVPDEGRHPSQGPRGRSHGEGYALGQGGFRRHGCYGQPLRDDGQHIHVQRRPGLASIGRLVIMLVDNLCVQRGADTSEDELHQAVKT